MFVASVLLMPSLFFFFFARLVQPPFWLFAAFLPSFPRRPSYRVLPSLSPHNSILSYWRKLGGHCPPARRWWTRGVS